MTSQVSESPTRHVTDARKTSKKWHAYMHVDSMHLKLQALQTSHLKTKKETSQTSGSFMH